MGNDSSSGITIDVDRNTVFYYSGETISGTVKINITEEHLRTSEIYISITGEIGYATARSAPIGVVIHATSAYIETQFYYKKVSLSGSNMAEQDSIYHRGQYAWPFRIPLIDHLPPTINKPDVFPRVRYFLEVVIDKPWYKSNIRRKKYLKICPRVDLLQNPRYLTSSIFECENRKDIILRTTMNKIGYVSGENIQFTLDIQNPRKLLIRNITLSMLKYHLIGDELNQSMLYKITLPKIENLRNAQIMEMFSIKIPSIKYPPSYKFRGENVNAFVRIYYMLKITAKLEGVFTNCHMHIPIILGTEPNSQSSISEDDDLPPDYETVMRSLR